jgi:glycosyl hydrolase family 25
MLVSNRAKIRPLGFGFCGLYQYLRADQDVTSQASAFINWIGPDLNPGEIPILDLEEGSGDQSSRATQWFGIIDDTYHLASLPLSQRSWLYSGQDFAVSAGLTPIYDSARRTWIAAYADSDTGLLPHTLWQSTNGQVGANKTDWSGCGYCDTSLYDGTLAGLSALGWQPPTNQSLLLPEEEMQIQNGFANITTVTIGPTTEKVTVALPANCSGISFQRQDDASNWATIAYNLGA